MQPHPQSGVPSYASRIWYARAGEWPGSNIDPSLEMVSAQDPNRAAQLSVLYGIRDRLDQVTIALVIANLLLVFLLGATVVLR